MPDEFVSVRYIVDDVEAAVPSYTTHFGFELRTSAAPAIADVTRGHHRVLLSSPANSPGRPMPDGRSGQQIVLDEPAGNPIELFQPAGARHQGA